MELTSEIAKEGIASKPGDALYPTSVGNWYIGRLGNW
jgi:hypothetical protein